MVDAMLVLLNRFPIGQVYVPEPEPPTYSLLHVGVQHVALFTMVDAPLLPLNTCPVGQV
jgi:hypothetical protein